MKRISILIAVVLMTTLLTACGAGDVQGPGGESSSSDVSSAQVNSVSKEDYDSNIGGLKAYLEDSGYVSGEPREMSAQFIGAKEGYKYQFNYNNSDVSVEIYEYELSNLNETAMRVIDSVNSKGYFMMGKTEVQGVMSDNGKYLMIYVDSSDSKDNQNRKTEIINNFKVFH